jgi:Methyltransferase domain
MPLTNSDRHHWSPVPEIVNHLAAKYKGKRVLEIGPGHAPFPDATVYLDWQKLPGIPSASFVKWDIERGVPYEDKSFDFVYARHVLEDMWNPFHLMFEMSRVAKAGYIETPSPPCEMTRGVDGNSPQYRGYNHHRWIVWEGDGKLNFISKFPFVEYLAFADEAVTEQLLRSGPRFWNTSYLWEGEVNFRHLQCPHDFAMPQDYGAMLVKAMVQAKSSIEAFYRTCLNVA